MEQVIQYIGTNKLYPHKDNPRKEVGDVTELAESIKHSGVLQNLTVVPRTSTTYTVVIGHRRLAAAKLAGIDKLPCSVAIMDRKEQLATMISENMQRNDLTIYEQAQGIQTMIDMGETEKSISDRTGLSRSTVRRRAKLAKLDGELVKMGSERGATLLDFEKLEKLENEEAKERVLQSIGTKNFEMELKRAIEKERREKKKTEADELLSSFAEKIDNPNARGLVYVDFTDFGNRKIAVPDDANERKYYYTLSDYSASLYAEPSEENKREEAERAEIIAKARERKSRLEEAEKRAFELRIDFVKQLNPKKQVEGVLKFATSAIVNKTYGHTVDRSCLAFLTETEEEVCLERVESGELELSPEKTALFVAYSAFFDGKLNSYSNGEREWKENKRLDKLYEHLCEMGYVLSDEEEQLKNGTHELYRNNEEWKKASK